MDFNKLSSQENLSKTKAALEEKGYKVAICESGREALEKIKSLISKGSSVMHGSSETLKQVGYMEYLEAGTHGWEDLHKKVNSENDHSKRVELRNKSTTADYYLGSVHALTESGEMLIASNTGSQLPNIVYSSQNLILVISTKKIVENLDQAFKRIDEHVVPLEDERSQKAYGAGTKLNKMLIFYGESEYTGRNINILLVEEDLGY